MYALHLAEESIHVSLIDFFSILIEHFTENFSPFIAEVKTIMSFLLIISSPYTTSILIG